MNYEELNDNEVVINFDVTDNYNIPTKQGGYVVVRKDEVDKYFTVVVVDVDGNTQSKTHVPFNFEGV